MRRAFAVTAGVLLSVLAVGCGSSKAPGVSGPLATELSYFARDSVFVADIATDPHGPAVKSVSGLVASVPAAQLGIAALKSLLAARGVDYQVDIEPLFGNPVVIAVPRVSTSSPSASSFLLVWTPRSSLALTTLLKGLGRSAPVAKANGTTVYAASPGVVAVHGTTLVFGSSPAIVQAALARHAGGSGMSPAAFAQAMSGLPRNTFVQAQGSLAGVITGSALKIPWVAAIRGYAATLTGTSSGLTLNFRLDTSGAPLTSSQLPVATGTGAPELAGDMPIVVGIRDPARLWSFILAAGQSTGASGIDRFTRGQAAAKQKTGYNLSTFAALLSGSLIVESDGHKFLARADVSDPASASRQLAALPRGASDVFTGVRRVVRQPDGFFALYQAQGQPLELGLAGREFVVGLGVTPAQLRAYAALPATPAPNAGAIAFRVRLLELLHLALKRTPPPFIASLLSALGDITGSASATPSALTGTVALSVK